jgi:hypothetical protein
MVRRLALLLLGFCGAVLAAAMQYPIPDGARNQRHLRLFDTGGEQNYFEIVRPYPSTFVLEQYRKVFSRWTECKPAETWQSFGDLSTPKPRFVHQLLREWVRPDNRSVVTLAVLYYSEGTEHRARPDNDTQRVVLIEYEVPDGRAMAENLGYKCNGA